MGALRYTKDLKPQLLKQATNKHMILQETIIGDDQKIRYVRSLRERLFRHLRNTMKTYHSKQFTYLCMENADVWQSVYGFSHKNNHEFSTWFNNSVFL